MATDSFDKMCDCLFECKWFECHTDMQKYFILLMVNAQRPLQYDGSGIIILNLQTYGKVNEIQILHIHNNSSLYFLLAFEISCELLHDFKDSGIQVKNRRILLRAYAVVLCLCFVRKIN